MSRLRLYEKSRDSLNYWAQNPLITIVQMTTFFNWRPLIYRWLVSQRPQKSLRFAPHRPQISTNVQMFSWNPNIQEIWDYPGDSRFPGDTRISRRFVLLQALNISDKGLEIGSCPIKMVDNLSTTSNYYYNWECLKYQVWHPANVANGLPIGWPKLDKCHLGKV